MAEIKNTEMIRDALGSPIPQKWDEDSQTFIASTVDGSEANVDFSKKKMIRDRLGSPIPQKWDNDAGKFVPSAGGVDGEVTIESIPGLQTKLNETTVKLAETAKYIQQEKFDFDVNRVSFKTNDIRLDIETYITGNNDVVHPSILYFQEGWNGYKYWMAITAFPNQNNQEENPCVYCSVDGDDWIAPTANPIYPTPTYAPAYNADTHLFMSKDNKTMYCTWRIRNDSDYKNKLVVMSSTDGESWGDFKVILTSNNRDFASPSVIIDDGKFKLFAVNLDSPIANTTLDLYESDRPDGRFSYVGEIPVPVDTANRQLWHFELRKYKGTYVILYTIGNFGNYGALSNLHLAISNDLTNWKVKHNIMDTSNWAKTYYKSTFLIYKDGSGQEIIDLWYNGVEGWRVGRTKCDLYFNSEVLKRRVDIESVYTLQKAFNNSFIDTFKRGGLYNAYWLQTLGALSIDDNGVYTATNDNNSITVSSLKYTSDSLVKMNVKNATSSYIVFRYNNATDYYRFGVNSTNNLLLQKVSSTVTTLWTYPLASVDNCELMIVDRNSSISLYLNGSSLDNVDMPEIVSHRIGFQISKSATRVTKFELNSSGQSQSPAKTAFTPSFNSINTVTYTRQEGTVLVNGDLVHVTFRIDGTKSADTSQDASNIQIIGQSNLPLLGALGVVECSFNNTNIKSIYTKMVSGDNKIYVKKLEGVSYGDIRLAHLDNTFSVVGSVTFVK